MFHVQEATVRRHIISLNSARTPEPHFLQRDLLLDRQVVVGRALCRAVLVADRRRALQYSIPFDRLRKRT